VFFSGSFSRQAECGKLALPERRIRQRWEAARAPTQGLTESGGESATWFEHLLAGKRKSQGIGECVREDLMSLLNERNQLG
jgi:hypothetical protein